MDWFRLGLSVVTYLIVGVIIAKVTLGVQSQLRTQNNEEPLDEETRLGIAGLVGPLWPLFLGVLVLYLCLALVMNVFSRLMKPFV